MFVASSQNLAPVVSISAPAQYLVVDIETGEAPEQAIQAAIAAWKPGPTAKTAAEIVAEAEQAVADWRVPSNLKDPVKIEERRTLAMDKVNADRQSALDKITERQRDAAERIRSKSALLDSAPILCIGIQTQHGAVVFNGMDTIAYPIKGVQCIACGSERDMLWAVRQWLEIYTSPETVLVGQNVRNFDLPKLRSAFTRWKLKLPAILAPRIIGEQTNMVDISSLFKGFSVEHRDDFCPSLDTICNALSVPRPKAVMSGAEVPGMHRNGRYHEILTYNAIDIGATTRAYLLMSGQADDLT